MSWPAGKLAPSRSLPTIRAGTRNSPMVRHSRSLPRSTIPDFYGSSTAIPPNTSPGWNGSQPKPCNRRRTSGTLKGSPSPPARRSTREPIPPTISRPARSAPIKAGCSTSPGELAGRLAPLPLSVRCCSVGTLRSIGRPRHSVGRSGAHRPDRECAISHSRSRA